ncbi:MAG: bacterioferritin [Thiotrichales bacterium]
MWANPRVSGYLTEALQHEMTAVQQYLTQASLCRMWGYETHAGAFRTEANEELAHAELLIERMLALGLVPNATRLSPVRPGRDLREMLLVDRKLELDAVLLYEAAARGSARLRDFESARLFERLLVDEEAHVREIDSLLANHECTAVKNGG